MDTALSSSEERHVESTVSSGFGSEVKFLTDENLTIYVRTDPVSTLTTYGPPLLERTLCAERVQPPSTLAKRSLIAATQKSSPTQTLAAGAAAPSVGERL